MHLYHRTSLRKKLQLHSEGKILCAFQVSSGIFKQQEQDAKAKDFCNFLK